MPLPQNQLNTNKRLIKLYTCELIRILDTQSRLFVHNCIFPKALSPLIIIPSIVILSFSCHLVIVTGWSGVYEAEIADRRLMKEIQKLSPGRFLLCRVPNNNNNNNNF